MGSGFDIGLQASQERLAQRNQIAAQQRQQQQNTVGMQLLDAINQSSNIKPDRKNPDTGAIEHNPEYDSAQADRAKLLSQYSALNSPEAHASFGQHLHGLIFGKPEANPQQPALSANSSPNTPTPPPAAPVQGPPQPATPPHPFSTDHPALAKINEGIKTLGEGIKNHAGAFAHPLPAQTQPDPALIAKYYRDPAEVAHERQMEVWGQRGQTAEDVANIRGKYMAAGRPPRFLSQETIPDLLKERQVDPELEIYGPDGRIISDAQLSEMPQGMIARKFQKGSQMIVALGDQNSKFITVGNERIEVPSIGAVTPQNSTNLGVANTGGASTHQVPGMNPGEVVTLTNTHTPATTGMTGGAPVAAPTPVGQPTLKTRPMTGQSNPPNGGEVNSTEPPPREGAVPSASQQALNNRLNAKRSVARQVPTGIAPATALAKTGVYPDPPPPFAPGTMLTQGKTTKPVIAKADAVAANIFGGGDEKPLWTNAAMFDDPKIRTALNTALTMNALAIPGTADDPTLMQQLATAVGATNWSQQQINDAVVKAKQDLQTAGGPEAMKMFARMAGMQEDLTALRAITGSSAAAQSIKTMVRAAPVYNVSSAANFRDQLGATLNTAAKALHAYPEINPAYVKWWTDGAKLARGGPVSANAPKVPSEQSQIRVQHSASTGQDRYSTDGGKTWQMGKPPQQ